ncbi:MAG: hypothetical protein KAX49_16565 [Halanaerobiales bacterium]|nr:hypothetical protein [Halanaerobiales bacterium]
MQKFDFNLQLITYDDIHKERNNVIELGHKNVAIIIGPLKYLVNRDRYDGFR